MKILVHTIFYRPELVGVAKYTSEMCTWLVGRGHEVDVVCPPPYYPSWKVEAPYRHWWYQRESLDGARVTRCPIWIPKQPRGLSRVLYSLSFLISSFPALLCKMFRRPDLVFVLEPSLLNAISSLLVAKCSGSLAWLHIKDFEIDIAFDLGQLKRPWIRSALQRFESWLMRQFDVVSTISRPMESKALAKGVESHKLVFFPDWVDTGVIFPMSAPSPLRSELGIPIDSCVALFSGTLNAKAGVEVVIAAARRMAETNTSGVQFLICGDGPFAEQLSGLASGLPNIRFIPLQSHDRLNDLLNIADMHLLPQLVEVADLVLPSKLLGMLASGRPVVATVRPDSEVGRFVGNCGLLVPPGDSAGLVDAIRELAADGESRARLGAEARRRAIETLQQERILADFEREVLARLNPQPAGAVAESGALK